MLDVDFLPSKSFKQFLRDPLVKETFLSLGSKRALVLPAFEFRKGSELNPSLFPSSKSALLPLMESGQLSEFHKAWSRGHMATDYLKWANATQPYLVMEYGFSYEPYVIMRREGPPW